MKCERCTIMQACYDLDFEVFKAADYPGMEPLLAHILCKYPYLEDCYYV